MNISFSTAVLVSARAVASGASQFSAYDVTRKLRQSVNDGEITFSDRNPEDVNGNTTYRVEHEDVKSVINDLYVAQVLGRQNGSAYYLYSFNALAAQLPTPQPVAYSFHPIGRLVASGNVTLGQPGAPKAKPARRSSLIPADFAAKLKTYLQGRGNGPVTMKQIQSRFDNVVGVSCKDYADEVVKLGYKLDISSNPKVSDWYINA